MWLNAYSISFCLFDSMGSGESVYSFENRCTSHLDIALGDGAHAVLLSAVSPRQAGVSDALNDLLDYIAEGRVKGALPVRVNHRVRQVISSND